MLIEDDTDTTSSSEPDTAEDSCIDTDTNPDTDTMPSGLGDTCGDNDDCACKEASYCAINPNEPPGHCAIPDCLDGTNECPEGLVCCAFSRAPGYPSMCISSNKEDYDNIDKLVGC
jgi:hypothetical protein